MKKRLLSIFILGITFCFMFSSSFSAIACNNLVDLNTSADCEGYTTEGSVHACPGLEYLLTYSFSINDGDITGSGVKELIADNNATENYYIPFVIEGSWPEEVPCGNVIAEGAVVLVVDCENPPCSVLDTDSFGPTEVLICDCGDGCTLTPGYWKTHSEKGPAPYDNTWAKLSNGADTLFFDTGKTYYEVLWTPPKGGNAYYILAHQYIAAYLNQLNGASMTTVADELDHAASLLDQYDSNPMGMDNIKGAVRKDFINTADILDKYNNGYIGPGHCTE
jgi:hypothetical protein